MKFPFVPLMLSLLFVPLAQGRTVNWSASANNVYVCDRTPEIRDLLLRAVDKSCGTILPSDLLSVTNLSLSAKQLPKLKQLKPGDLSGLPNVTSLQIDGDIQVPGDEIGTLPALVELDISGLTKPFPSNLIHNAALLKSLKLEGNNQGTLPADFFATSPVLENIVLRRNHLKAIPSTLFQGLKNLKRVAILDPDLVALPEGLFANLPALSQVYLRDKDGHQPLLPLRLFENSYAVEQLDLFDPGWVSPPMNIPPDLFHSLKRLTSLNLPDLPLANTLPKGAFCGMDNLTSVTASGNWLGNTVDYFCGNAKLEKVLLGAGDHALIRLSGLPNLHQIFLGNAGGAFTVDAFILDTLSFSGDPALEDVFINGVVNSSPGFLCGLPSLRKAALFFGTGDLPTSIFCPESQVSEVYLNFHIWHDSLGNRGSTIIPSSFFVGADSVQDLALVYGHITASNVLRPLRNLEKLSMSSVVWDAGVSNILPESSHLKWLKIYYSKNLNDQFSDLLGKSSSLEWLRIDGLDSSLHTLNASSFAGFPNLARVDVRAWPLTAIGLGTFSFPRFQEANICGSQLSQKDTVDLINRYGNKLVFNNPYETPYDISKCDLGGPWHD